MKSKIEADLNDSINFMEQKLNPGAVYELHFKITFENKLRSFQFMLIHNIIPTNQRLWQMNIKTSPQCEECNFPTETIISFTSALLSNVSGRMS